MKCYFKKKESQVEYAIGIIFIDGRSGNRSDSSIRDGRQAKEVFVGPIPIFAQAELPLLFWFQRLQRRVLVAVFGSLFWYFKILRVILRNRRSCIPCRWKTDKRREWTNLPVPKPWRTNPNVATSYKIELYHSEDMETSTTTTTGKEKGVELEQEQNGRSRGSRREKETQNKKKKV